MEKLEETVDAKQRIRMVHYYYINYKAFVNAVKYKLDQMREKIENEARKVVFCLCKLHMLFHLCRVHVLFHAVNFCQSTSCSCIRIVAHLCAIADFCSHDINLLGALYYFLHAIVLETQHICMYTKYSTSARNSI